MWFWPLNERKAFSLQQVLWIRLITVSAVLHALILFMLLFMYRGYAQLQVDAQGVSLSPAEVVLMPLQKVVAKPQVIPRRKQQQKELQEKKVEQPVEKKVQEPAAAAKPTTGLSVPKKRELRRAQRQQKKEAKKEVAQEIKAAQEPIKEPVQAVEPLPVPQATETILPEAAASNEPIYVGREELEALVVQQEIQKEIEQRWHPPIGISPETTCQVRALIGWDGAIKEVKMEKSSGVLVFDVHARSVTQAIVFPKAVWGKELIMHFNNRA